MSYDGGIIAHVSPKSVSGMAEVLFRMTSSRGPGNERYLVATRSLQDFRSREHRKVFELSIDSLHQDFSTAEDET